MIFAVQRIKGDFAIGTFEGDEPINSRYIDGIWLRWKNGSYTQVPVVTVDSATRIWLPKDWQQLRAVTKAEMQSIVQNVIWAKCNAIAKFLGVTKNMVYTHLYGWMKEQNLFDSASIGVKDSLRTIRESIPYKKMMGEALGTEIRKALGGCRASGPAMAAWFVRQIGDTDKARELIEKACQLYEVSR